MKNIHRRAMLQAGIAAAGSAFALTAHAQARPGARRILVGQSVPLTGAADQIGLAFSGGAKLFFDVFNGSKTPAAWSFELRQSDDGYDPRRAAANAQKLLDDGADILFGFVGTGSTDAASEVAARNGALFFAPFAASDKLRDPALSHVFHVRPSLTDEARKMLRHCATLSQTRIALMAEDDALGREGLRAVQQVLVELKMPPLVAHAFVPVNSDKVDAAVAVISKAQPQAILQASLFNSTAAFIRAMRRAKYVGAFLNFSVVGIDPLFTALGKEIHGVVVSQVVPSPRTPTTPIVREYLAALDSSDQTPSYEGLEGYIAAKTLAEAIRRSGRPGDRAALQRAMMEMKEYDIGGLRINLHAGVRDTGRHIDLVTVTADGRIVR